jgi:hypothetical protein
VSADCPGAALGGAAGSAARRQGRAVAADGNTDLGFRSQQMREASGAMPRSRSGVRRSAGRSFRGRRGHVASAAAKKEFIGRSGCFNQATARCRRSSAPQPGRRHRPANLRRRRRKKPKKGPTDRSDAVEFQFAQEQRQLDLRSSTPSASSATIMSSRPRSAFRSLDIEKQIKDAEIDHKVEKAKRDAAEGKITQSALAQVIADAGSTKGEKEATLDHLKRQAVLEAEQEQRFKDVQRLDNVNFDLQKQKLQSESSLAKPPRSAATSSFGCSTSPISRSGAARSGRGRQAVDRRDKEEARRRLAALGGQYGATAPTSSSRRAGRSSSISPACRRRPLRNGGSAAGRRGRRLRRDRESLPPTRSPARSSRSAAFGDVTRRSSPTCSRSSCRSDHRAAGERAVSGCSAAAAASVAIFGGLVGGVDPRTRARHARLRNRRFVPDRGNMGTDRNSLSLNGIPIARVSHGENVSIGTGGGGGIVINQTIAPNFAGNAATQDDLQRMAVITKAGDDAGDRRKAPARLADGPPPSASPRRCGRAAGRSSVPRGRIELPDPVYAWTGIGTLIFDDADGASRTWQGAGGIGAVDTIGEATDGSATGVKGTLFEVPSEFRDDIERQAVRGVIMELYVGTLNETYQQVDATVLLWKGRLDQYKITDGGATLSVEITGESRAIDQRRPAIKRFTDEYQQRKHPGDLFFQYVRR